MLNWPNRITLARILLIPVLVMVAIQAGEEPAYRAWTLAIFIGLALTDAADGFLARVLRQKTPLGTFLDPLADKLLLATATVLLVLPIWPDPQMGEPSRLIPTWIAVIVISRDLLLAIGTLLAFMLTGAVKIHPSMLGKATTAAQIAMIVGALWPLSPAVLSPLLSGTAALTVASLAGYLYDWTRQISGAGTSSPSPGA